jgi:hypothetical protein
MGIKKIKAERKSEETGNGKVFFGPYGPIKNGVFCGPYGNVGRLAGECRAASFSEKDSLNGKPFPTVVRLPFCPEPKIGVCRSKEEADAKAKAFKAENPFGAVYFVENYDFSDYAEKLGEARTFSARTEAKALIVLICPLERGSENV